MPGSPPAEPVTIEGRSAVRLPCPFAGPPIPRASWDTDLRADLSNAEGLAIVLRSGDLSPVAGISVYLKSGAGWYHLACPPPMPGRWTTVVLGLEEAGVEGKPAGWDQIEGVRISILRAGNTDTEFHISSLHAVGMSALNAKIAVVRADSARDSPEFRSATDLAAEAVRMLRASGIPCTAVSDAELTAGRLSGVRLVVLPYCPTMPPAAEAALASWVAGGGKVLAFYSVPAALHEALGVTGGDYIRAERRDMFSAIRVHPGSLPGAPDLLRQSSHNIRAFDERPPVSRRLADWLDSEGRPTGYAALIGSDRGLVMTHVLMPRDQAEGARFLGAAVGWLLPEVWAGRVERTLQREADEAGAVDISTAVTAVWRASSSSPRARSFARDAAAALAAVRRLSASGRHVEALGQAEEVRRGLERAHCAAQTPTPLKFRAFWCHDAYGVRGRTWDEAVRRLKDNGFTAVVPNMLWGGVAYHPSGVLPVAADVAVRGDAIAECLAACRRHGIEMHVWKVNWNLGPATPREFVERLRSEGRLQAGSDGSERLWLCPSHPDNRRLEVESMLEVARKYPVDGLHFDYIRYPDADHCFCAGCRERFEAAVGERVHNWPADVRRAGLLRDRWNDWRRGNISQVVRAVAEEARRIRPGIRISAAVFRHWAVDRDLVAQDWKVWCDEGWMDFVCPMNYTDSTAMFDAMVGRQVGWAGRVPLVPGIGVSASSSRFGARRAIEQIRVAERRGAAGFIVFNYGEVEYRDLLPLLGLGVTRPAGPRARLSAGGTNATIAP